MNCNTPTMLRLSEIHNQTSVDNTMVILIIKYSLSLFVRALREIY